MSSEEGQKVLVVDDESTLELAEKILSDLGYSVSKAPSGEKGLSAAETQTPDFILLDLAMPDMDGFETLRKLKERASTRAIPVIVVSADSAEDSVVKAVKAGASSYVLKPLEKALLEEKINSIKTRLSSNKAEINEKSKNAEANLEFAVKLVSLSDQRLEILSPIELHESQAMSLQSQILKEMGISITQLKLESCEKEGEGYRASFHFNTAEPENLKDLIARL